MWVRINKWSCIKIRNQQLVPKELGIHGDTFVAVQLPDNWPTKATRSGWRILDPSTNIHPALLTAVDTCTHWVPIFGKTQWQAHHVRASDILPPGFFRRLKQHNASTTRAMSSTPATAAMIAIMASWDSPPVRASWAGDSGGTASYKQSVC